MTIEQITDHVEQSQARMVQRWKNKDNEDKILKIRSARLQILEDIFIRLLNERALSTGSGVQLDGIGEFYGTQGERNARSDTEYRAYLQVLPAKLRQAGQHEILVAALQNLTNAIRIETEYVWPRAIIFYIVLNDVDDLTNESEVNKEMQKIKAEGIRLDLGTKKESGNFILSSSSMGAIPANSGLASLSDGSDGGSLYKLIGTNVT